MERPFSLWNSQRKGADYQFIDGIISEWFQRSGPSIYVHKLLGAVGSDVDQDGNPVTSGTTNPTVAQIQDVVLMENRDRKYDPNVKELYGVFQIPDYDMAMLQFQTVLSNDTLFIDLHINDMLATIGRKVMAGDVVELPNFRDDALVGQPNTAVNKYYQVTEAKRPAHGYQATWWPHMWRIKCDPLTASQETADLLSQQTQNPLGLDNGTLASLITNTAALLGVNEQVIEQAQQTFLRRNFETQHLWIVPGDNNQSAWVFTGDGIPPNGAVLSGQGDDWPENPSEGDYFLRTDHLPNALYLYTNRTWEFQEMDYRDIWTGTGRLMLQYLNNRDTITFKDGTTQPSKQDLYKAVKPAVDFSGTVHPSDAEEFPSGPNPYRS